MNRGVVVDDFLKEKWSTISNRRVKTMKRLLCILVLVLSSLLYAGAVRAKIIDKIVAVVNSEIITLSELKSLTLPYIERMKSKYALEYTNEQVRETEQSILGQLIDEKLITQEADRLEIVITDKEVEMALRDVKENNKLTDEQFAQALTEEGITLERYREDLKNQMRKMRLLEQVVKSKIQVKKEEVEQYLKEHGDDFDTPPEVRLQQILFLIPTKSNEQEIAQVQNRAEEVLRAITSGGDFEALAKLHSQDASAASGGHLGFFKQGELMPPLNDAAFTLKVGEVSPVIQTSLGFHIIKVEELRERKKMTKETQSKEIETILYNQKVEDAFKQWLKEIRKKSYIEITL